MAARRSRSRALRQEAHCRVADVAREADVEGARAEIDEALVRALARGTPEPARPAGHDPVAGSLELARALGARHILAMDHQRVAVSGGERFVVCAPEPVGATAAGL